MKIDSHRLEIKDTCNPEYIEAIKKYWVLENNTFINKPITLGEPFGFTAYEFAFMVKKESNFFIEIKCDLCQDTESIKITSHSNFLKLKSKFYNSTSQLFSCSNCKAKKEAQKKEALEKQKSICIEKQKLAIKNQVWSVLNPLQLKVLKCIVKNKGFSKLSTTFKNIPRNTIWSAIYTLRDLNLIVLHFKQNTSSVQYISSLPELESVLPEVKIVVKNEPKAAYNNISRALKLKLTKNKVPKDGDSPLYSGVLNFEEDVLIEQGTQYTFGVWKRELDNLYLTLVPTDAIYKAPKQQPVSVQPKPLREAIQDFFDTRPFDL